MSGGRGGAPGWGGGVKQQPGFNPNPFGPGNGAYGGPAAGGMPTGGYMNPNTSAGATDGYGGNYNPATGTGYGTNAHGTFSADPAVGNMMGGKPAPTNPDPTLGSGVAPTPSGGLLGGGGMHGVMGTGNGVPWANATGDPNAHPQEFGPGGVFDQNTTQGQINYDKFLSKAHGGSPGYESDAWKKNQDISQWSDDQLQQELAWAQSKIADANKWMNGLSESEKGNATWFPKAQNYVSGTKNTYDPKIAQLMVELKRRGLA